MIQSSFRTPRICLNSIIRFIGLLFCSIGLKAQIPDTVYVYDTLVVYDTIVIHDTLRLRDEVVKDSLELEYLMHQIEVKQAIIQIDTATSRANLLVPFGYKSATIPINGIILTENTKKLESMKKYSFFGLVFFAFQTMVIAQADYGISAGSGIWWPHTKEYEVSTEVAPTFNAGVFISKGIFNNRFGLELEVNYHFLMNNYTYKFVVNTLEHRVIGDAEAASCFHQVSVPLNLFLNLQKFKVYTGLEYAFRTSESWAKDASGNRYAINSLGLTAGLSYQLTGRLLLDLRFRQGLTVDIDRMEYSYYTGQQLHSIDYNLNWKSSQAGLSVFYSLAKKKSRPVQQLQIL